MPKEYGEIQAEEARTWCIEDPIQRLEKISREIVRYPYMAKQMGLTLFDTSGMLIWDIGGGPVGLSSVVACRERLVIDPLAKEYGKYFDPSFHRAAQGEHLGAELATPDLTIITNALDHFEHPAQFIRDLVEYARAGTYFAQFHAINNAIAHPHEAHAHNINPEWLHQLIDTDFETVWEMTYARDGLRYGWVPYNGKVGQPAFAGLYRKTTGYSDGKDLYSKY